MYNEVRNYLRDFQQEFDHSEGLSRYSFRSAVTFYDKWSVFITLVTGVTLANLNRDNVRDMYCIANTCALKIKTTFN